MTATATHLTGTTMTNTEAGANLVRHTRQRTVIAETLAGTGQLLTAQQVHRQLVEAGHRVGLATVYRTLAAMVEAGQADAVRTGGQLAYRCCSSTHHHHLTCRGCGDAVEISAPPLEQWAYTVASEHGYSGAQHVIEISGLCPTCQQTTRRPAAAANAKSAQGASWQSR